MQAEDNPYAAPESALEIADDASLAWDDVSAAELRAYVGPRASHYLHVWRPALERPGAWAGFNWAALLLCPLWLPYRRMYIEACVVWIVAFGLTEASDVVLQMRFARFSPWHGVALFVSFVGVPLTCGIFGNGRYLARARRAIAATHAFGLTGQAAAARLAHVGRTDALSAFGLNVLCFCGTLVIDQLVMMLVF